MTSLMKPSENDTQFEGIFCNCPSDCDATVYLHETSNAKIRKDNNFVKTLRKNDRILHQLESSLASFKEEVEMFNIGNDGVDYENWNCKDNQLCYDIKENKRFLDSIVNDTSVAHFFYKQTGMISYKRDRLFTLTDMLGIFSILWSS